MKKLLFLLLLISANTFAQPLKVLFIGNSYTASNNLASRFTQLALSKGDTVRAYSVNPGGYTFQLHTAYAPTLAMIDSMDWDYVILQEQSQLPSFPPQQVATDVYPYARQLDSLILLNNPCTETVFFMTWGRKYGDASNCAFWPPVCTFTGMQQQLRDSYVAMANDNHALVAPVGEAWKRSWFNDSTINLWVSDNSHPDVPGSYLTACVFYTTIFRKSVAGASYTAGLTTNIASYLQLIADTTVFDSLSTWKIGSYDVQADFNYVAAGLDLQFNNLSVNGVNYFWDFGDGNTSTDPAPMHNYSQTGTYPVLLIADDGCSTDSSQQSVTVTATAVQEADLTSCVSFLGNGAFRISCSEFRSVKIYDNLGRLIKEPGISGTGVFSLGSEYRGLYTLVFQRNDGGREILRCAFN